jgi:hypothetical protein
MIARQPMPTTVPPAADGNRRRPGLGWPAEAVA